MTTTTSHTGHAHPSWATRANALGHGMILAGLAIDLFLAELAGYSIVTGCYVWMAIREAREIGAARVD